MNPKIMIRLNEWLSNYIGEVASNTGLSYSEVANRYIAEGVLASEAREEMKKEARRYLLVCRQKRISETIKYADQCNTLMHRSIEWILRSLHTIHTQKALIRHCDELIECAQEMNDTQMITSWKILKREFRKKKYIAMIETYKGKKTAGEIFEAHIRKEKIGMKIREILGDQHGNRSDRTGRIAHQEDGKIPPPSISHRDIDENDLSDI